MKDGRLFQKVIARSRTSRYLQGAEGRALRRHELPCSIS